ncbi:CLUMA_CG021465, isoform A [Clunio marinus]|uniref:CLUMA_CG021465, isoform A n=1 Tax=Clunio marinus TaxID=568069 RepID=A0A1J1J7H7_9DIPT|nr:CLUMA_CG021465, isoform A [Clunio marinus]
MFVHNNGSKWINVKSFDDQVDRKWLKDQSPDEVHHVEIRLKWAWFVEEYYPNMLHYRHCQHKHKLTHYELNMS